MENNNNGSSKSMLQSNNPQSDGATDMSPTSGEGTSSTRNIKMLPVSYSVLDSGPLKREIGTIVNNQQIKCCQDEEDAASKLKDVVECVKINVRFNGSKFSVQVALESTVESFKELIVGNCGIPVQNQRLFYKAKILQNDQSLQSYGLGANHTVFLVRCFAPTDTDDGTNTSDTGTATYDDDSDWDDDSLQGDFQPMQLPYDGNAWDRSTNIETNVSSSLPNTTPLPNPWAPNTAPLLNPWAYTEIVDRQYNIRRSTTDVSELEGMLEHIFMQNDAFQTQLVQDPPTPQFIEFIPSNPEALCQFDGRNIEQDGMPDLSSLREEIQNSEFLRLSFQPETMQQPPSFWEEDLQPEPSQQQPMQEPDQTTGDTDMQGACECSEILQQLFATQLSQLHEMGFNDTEENIRVLMLTSGNIDAAVRHLRWLSRSHQ